MKKYISLTILLSCILVFSSNVFAYTGFIGYDSDFWFDWTSCSHANSCFNKCGYTSTTITNFTKANVQSKVPSVRCFYVYCHGGSTSNSIKIQTHSGEIITSSEMYSWTRGFYKFVYIDACHSGDNDAMYRAFNMYSGDGLSHAYLGWKGTVDDSIFLDYYNNKLFNDLAAGVNLNDSVWNARIASGGISNYKIYGDWRMKLK